MAAVRSLVHMLWMLLTVVPVAIYLLTCAAFGASSHFLYRVAVFWLWLAVAGAEKLLGIRHVIEGFENLPTDDKPAVLLVKHQSTYETFLMPVIMPRDLAYVFKKELLQVPFFGWAIGQLDMVHIDRSLRKQAFQKVAERGRDLLQRGLWVIMFPEGTRIARGEAGQYKSGGARLAIDAGVPVVPVAVNSGMCWPRKAFIKHAGLVTVSIGKPIESHGRQSDELMAEVEQWIEAEMRRLDPAAYPPSSQA